MRSQICVFIVVFGSYLFGTVSHSIIPEMTPSHIEAQKLSLQQLEVLDTLPKEKMLRVMSFNMLFNIYDEDLESENRWSSRGVRVEEYVRFAQPDIIGSQELQPDQLAQLEEALGDTYAYYGVEDQGEIMAIFYRKERLELLEGKTYRFAGQEKDDTFTVGYFRDLETGKECRVVNTHLAYRNLRKRMDEAEILGQFVHKMPQNCAIIVTGDFNTFPFRRDLPLPFYDGREVERVVKGEVLEDARDVAAVGHVGPLSTTNFCTALQRSFCLEGEPGVILDHIFVNDRVTVYAHGIDPARVDGFFPSDHLPVIADLFIGEK